MTSNIPETRTIPFGRPWIDDADRDAVMRVLEGHILTHGPECVEFEREFSEFVGDGAQCVTVSSCAAALHLAYEAFDLGPGDEVILPAETHVATANTAEWVGATSVFVDCELHDGNLAAERIAAAITPRTKAITVVHFSGIPADMQPIVDLAAKHDIKVIEDCALALGGRRDGKHVGLFGDVGCFSFYPVKHITTAEGGMFITKHADLAQRVARMRAHGVDKTHTERSVPGMYDLPMIGLNYRMSEPQAALGRGQLQRMGENLDRRRRNFDTIAGALNELDDVNVLDGPGNSWYCLSAVLSGDLVERRSEIVSALTADGIGTSLYYPQPVPRMRYYADKYGYETGTYPNAEAISDGSIALPVGPHLGDGDADYIVASFRRAVEAAA